jgi:hypothetical protein
VRGRVLRGFAAKASFYGQTSSSPAADYGEFNEKEPDPSTSQSREKFEKLILALRQKSCSLSPPLLFLSIRATFHFSWHANA